MSERFRWDTWDRSLSLPEVIQRLNDRMPRVADLVARLQRTNVRAVAANTTFTASDDLIVMDTTGGSRTITLPDARRFTGTRFTAKKGAAANTLTLDGNGATIDGAGTKAWTTQHEAHTVVSDGTAWHVMASTP